jgi:hypothetical protein
MDLHQGAEISMTMGSESEARRDPGDAVPPGVAPEDPAPLTDEDRKVKRKLEQLGKGDGDASSPPGEPKGRAETIGPEKQGA